MDEFIKVLLFSFISGVTVFLGGLTSYFYQRHTTNNPDSDKTVHTSVAFGGGIIIAAVAFVLVPEGMEALPALPMVIAFLLGALVFFFLDRAIQTKGGSMSQLMAMLMDFVPEAIALGAMFAADPELGLLLAIFIGLQNYPEAFNSYIDLKASGISSSKCLCLLFALSFSGVLAAALGYLFLADVPEVTAALMLFAGGGILYLIFQDIAPLSKMKNSWFPALGACLGFLVGMIGEKLIG